MLEFQARHLNVVDKLRRTDQGPLDCAEIEQAQQDFARLLGAGLFGRIFRQFGQECLEGLRSFFLAHARLIAGGLVGVNINNLIYRGHALAETAC